MSERRGIPPSEPTATPLGEERGGHLAFVAHEVRNPLSTALWSAELLARMSAEERGGARGEKLTGMCLRSLGRVRQLVEDHFLCERLDAGGVPARPEPLDVRAVIDEVAARRPADVGEVRIEVAPDLQVVADRALFERAVEALVSAAGRDGTVVRVAGGEGEPGRVVLDVAGADPGPGALEDPKKGAQGDPKGRALALPMARRVAVSMGGTLDVREGAFVLTLPRPADLPIRPRPAASP